MVAVMITTLRRLFWVALLAGAGYAGWLAWQRRGNDESTAPEWPPLGPPPQSDRPVGFMEISVQTPDAPPATPPHPHTGTAPGDAAETTNWVPPVDGKCPDGYPIKANDNSGIFHVPGGRFYERTVPERCYADAHDAEADGYRRAKA